MANFEKKEYTTQNEKMMDFAIGLVGGLLANALLGLIVYGINIVVGNIMVSSQGSIQSQSYYPLFGITMYVVACIPFVANIVALIYLLAKRKFMGFGLLALIVCLYVIVPLLLFGSCLVMIAGLSNVR